MSSTKLLFTLEPIFCIGSRKLLLVLVFWKERKNASGGISNVMDYYVLLQLTNFHGWDALSGAGCLFFNSKPQMTMIKIIEKSNQSVTLYQHENRIIGLMHHSLQSFKFVALNCCKRV